MRSEKRIVSKIHISIDINVAYYLSPKPIVSEDGEIVSVNRAIIIEVPLLAKIIGGIAIVIHPLRGEKREILKVYFFIGIKVSAINACAWQDAGGIYYNRRVAGEIGKRFAYITGWNIGDGVNGIHTLYNLSEDAIAKPAGVIGAVERKVVNVIYKKL